MRIARFHVRAALGFHGLDEYADVAVMITSELVTNAIRHVGEDPGETIRVTLAHVWDQLALGIIVTDSSPEGPVMREASSTSERGRGLQVVEALSDHWGWHPETLRQGGLCGDREAGITSHGRHLRPADAPRYRCRLHAQYVKLARVLRDKIESGQYQRGDTPPCGRPGARARRIAQGRMERARDARREPICHSPWQLQPLQRHLADRYVTAGVLH